MSRPTVAPLTPAEARQLLQIIDDEWGITPFDGYPAERLAPLLVPSGNAGFKNGIIERLIEIAESAE